MVHFICCDDMIPLTAKDQVVTREALDSMLDEYYKSSGWSEEGVPGEDKLRALSLRIEAI